MLPTSTREIPKVSPARPVPDDDSAGWFLTGFERGNDSTAIDRRHADGLSWTVGNRVQNLIHGATYFLRLLEAIRELNAGDQLFFTDWRGDPDQLLDGTKESEIGTVLADAARRGVSVKGLLWRSHADRLGFSARENRHLGEHCNAAGGEVLLDQRVRLGGSHHQKLVVIRHATAPGTTPTITAIRSIKRWRRSMGTRHRGTTPRWRSTGRRLATWNSPFESGGMTTTG
jgi:phosphatidylserine/phosphatidylglycerophosphate/cardiolipin synthase-like enzyme